MKIMFNKKFNLVYMKYLKQLNETGVEILYINFPRSFTEWVVKI